MYGYRAWLNFLGVALFSCALTMGASAYMPQKPMAGVPLNLGKDEAYRRDGTLADMRTCLAVADDEPATRLLRLPAIQAVLGQSPFQRAETLRSMASDMNYYYGFGTLLTCAEIVSAWHSRTLATSRLGTTATARPPGPQHDGRFEHGAFVIDLAIEPKGSDGSNKRLGIASQPLARLLTSPGILPPSAYGGIVVKNAVIRRPLILHNLRVIRPIAFINVKFSGGTVSQELYDIPERTAVTALIIASAQLEKQVVFAGSEFCGAIAIRDAHFNESLAFRDVEQFGIDCTHRPDATSAIALTVVDSRVDQSLSIDRSRLAATTVAGSDIEKMTANQVDFGTGLEIEENRLGSLKLTCSVFANRSNFFRNHIDQGALLEGTAYQRFNNKLDSDCRHWWQQPHLRHSERSILLSVENNRIDGGLTFRNFSGAEINPPVKIKHNTIGGRSLIVTPAPLFYIKRWQGTFDLQGNRHEGTLELRRSPWPSYFSAQSGRTDDYCRELSKENRLNGVAFELRTTYARTILWNLPLTCDYRWSGYGLTYDLWIKGKLATDSLAQMPEVNAIRADHIAFEAWRKTLRIYEPSSLTTVSNYLADKGEYVESRQVLLEAKRLNYVPDCAPDQIMPLCAISMIGDLLPSGSEPEDEAKADEDLVNQALIARFPNDFDHRFFAALEWLWRFAMLILLWPGGYGAQPERAFILLLGFSFVCWIAYWQYTKGMRKKLLLEWSAIDGFFKNNTDLIAKTTRLVDKRPGLAEVQVPFEDPSSGNTSSLWIAKEIWQWRMAHQERLREIQGPLLKRVKAWEDAASETDVRVFRNFRESLERFGNTEIAGFGRFDVNKLPKRFTERIYSFDTMLPVIDLHAYSNYYPINGWMRLLSVVQHVFGWWWVTVFIASAAIL